MHAHEESWSNGPHFVYAPHEHPYHKTILCDRGSIRFRIHRDGGDEDVELKAGDRLELPARTRHSAFVGSEGVACTERHRYG